MVPSRRQMLATLGLALSGLAGCAGAGDPDLVIENGLDRSVSVDVKITRLSDRRVILQADRSIGAGETSAFSNRVDESAEFRIRILASDVNAGGTGTVRYDGEGALGVRATIESGGIRFGETTE